MDSAQCSLASCQDALNAKDRQISELQDVISSKDITIAALREENESLCCKLSDSQQQLEVARTELQETVEEMQAAWCFSENEFQQERRQMEAARHHLQGIVGTVVKAAMDLQAEVEQTARLQVQTAEEEERQGRLVAMYRQVIGTEPKVEIPSEGAAPTARAEAELHWLCRALHCSLPELQDKFLGRVARAKSTGYPDVRAPVTNLYKMYLIFCDVGFPSDEAVKLLLRDEEHLSELFFNALGHEPCYGEHNCSIPSSPAAYDFARRVVQYLPKLERVYFCHLPPLSSPEGRLWAMNAPPKLRQVNLLHTDFTVADLFMLRQRCRALQYLCVHSSRCTDWGEYAGLVDIEERKQRLNKVCRGRVSWFD